MKVKIGDLTKIRTGKLDANASSEDGQYPFFTCSREPLKISSYSYDCECVLVAGNGDLNVKYYNGKFDAYQRTYIIEANGSGRLYMPFLYYFMEGYIEKLREQAIGGVIKYIKICNLTDAMIELPSLDEQKAIVEILEKAKKVLTLRKDEITCFDDIIKARFVEMFGDSIANDKKWQKTTLHGSLEKGRTVSYGIVQTGDEVEDGIPVFRPIDIAAGHIPKREELKKILPEISAKYQRTLLSGRELLVTVRGSVGETFQVGGEFAGCNVGRNIVPLITDQKKVNQRFLQELFAQEAIKRWLKSITKGIALQGLNMSEFKEMPVIAPPITLQNEFAMFAQQTDKSKVVELITYKNWTRINCNIHTLG